MAELEIERNTPRQELAQQIVFTGEAVFDEGELLYNIGGDRDLMDQIVALFLDDTRNQIEVLRAAFENGDVAAVKRQGHRLKGACANIRAGRLRKIFSDIEEAAARSQLPGVGGLLAAAAFEFEQFRTRASLRDTHGVGG